MEIKTEAEQRQVLANAILNDKDGNFVAHAIRETAFWRNNGEAYDRMVADSIVDVVRAFSAAGHSGFSAGIAAGALAKLLKWEPLGPLTGEDSEWVKLDYASDMSDQNNRCGHVFRRVDGTAYDGEAIIFRQPDGCCFQSIHSRAEVTFPYELKRVYADVPENYTDDDLKAAAQRALSTPS